jgi:hypothetical protein
MNEDFSEYRDLIKRMEATPEVPSPSGFTESVMGRLPEYDAGLLLKLKRVLNAQIGNGFHFGWTRESGAVSKKECSFYFFITGFFYLIMGIILMAGFKSIVSTSMAATEWIKLQPQFTLGAAIWLLALGMVLMMDGSTVIKIARYGTLCFIFLAVFNGIMMQSYLHVPYASMFTIGLVATSAIMGFMLALAVQKINLRPV